MGDMTTLIFILAFVQGISEFLPISSSGHLALIYAFTDLPQTSIQMLRLDIAAHSGTLLAVLIYFRRDILALIKALPTLFFPSSFSPSLRHTQTKDAQLLRLLIWASLPTIFVGAAVYMSGAIHYLRPTNPAQLLALVAWANILFALPLWAADKWCKKSAALTDLSPRHALFIGMMQIGAFIPGASRAGVTLTAGRALRLSRPEAARFSMLLSIPVIAAFALAQLTSLSFTPSTDILMPYALLTAFTAVIAFASIHIFMRMMAVMSLAPFILYRLGLGAVLLAILYI